MGERKRILIVVKTYPNPSEKYSETVCTAGITEDGHWIRLYPVRFRFLEGKKQYQKFEWISAVVTKADPARDNRLESYRIDTDSIERLGFANNTNTRCDIMLPLVIRSREELDNCHARDKTSLALLKPKTIDEFIASEDSPDWSSNDLTKLRQTSLLDDPNSKHFEELKKVPYRFSVRYHCFDKNCKGHIGLITDWEYNWTYFKYLAKYKTKEAAVQKLKEAWMANFSDSRDGYLILGTAYPHPSFFVVGYFSYVKDKLTTSSATAGRQISMF